MAGLSVHLLGPFQVALDGQTVTSFGYDKVRALLAYLAVDGQRPHRREALAGLLWPDQSEKAAHDGLRNALAKLRQAIDDQHAQPPYLIINREEIQFNQMSDHWLDVERFTQLLEACRTHRHRRIEGCPTCTDRLIEAAALYRGEFLDEFSLPDSDLFEDWVRLQREKYFQMAIDAVQKLVSTYEWRGEYEQALVYTRQMLVLDPCLEEAQVQAMKLYASLGMRTEACEQYEKCRELLANELSVEPMEETTRLYEQIKYGVFQAAPSRQSLRIDNLPTDLTSFVGREGELAEINALIEDPTCRLLTLVGPGGVGKTRLAIAAAGRQLEAFPHGACFVPLAGISSVESIVPTILQALGLKQAEQGDLEQQLFDYLKDKELVLVLDNFEHLLEGAGLVTEILQHAPGVMLLVTSRQRLGLQAEWVFEVNGLSYPAGKVTQNLAAYEAVMLFQQRLHQVKPRHSIIKDDLPGMTRICQLVEGLPLGIELAASAVRRKSIEQVATAIESGKEDLATSWKDVPERHRSIRAVFDHSYRQLSEEEQTAFIGLAVFRGGFTAEAAEQVAGTTEEILDALVEHSMVRYDPEKDRYDLHELVRQYASDRLMVQGMETQLHQQHLAYFIDSAEKKYSILLERRHWDDIISVVPEIENYRAATDWCFINEQLEYAMQLSGALSFFWESLGYLQEIRSIFMNILASCHNFKRDRYLARFLFYTGRMMDYKDLAEGYGYYEKSLSIYTEINDQRGIADTYVELASSLILQGKREKAIEFMESAVQIYQQLGNPIFIANAQFYLANHYFAWDYQKYQDNARSLCEQSLETYRRLERPGSINEAVRLLGTLEMNQGNFSQARVLFEEGQSHVKTRVNYDPTIFLALGQACFYLKDYPASYKNFLQALEISKNLSQKNISTLSFLSYLLCWQGELNQALFYFKETFQQLDEGQDRYYATIEGTLEMLPGVLLACGETERAAKLYGFTDMLREKQKASLPRYIIPDYERDLAETRRQLGEAEFNAAWEEGRGITLEQAKECALEAKVRITKTAEEQAMG